MYPVLGDIVVFVHLLWIIFLIAGSWPGHRWPWVKWLHLSALSFSIVLQLAGWTCPLTHLENWIRLNSGSSAYAGTFIGQYFQHLVYAPLSPTVVLVGTLIIVGTSLWIYFGHKR